MGRAGAAVVAGGRIQATGARTRPIGSKRGPASPCMASPLTYHITSGLRHLQMGENGGIAREATGSKERLGCSGDNQ